jgi:hypothetical protein
MSRSVDKIRVHIEIQNGGKQPFADLCAKITQESTTYLGPRMSKCFIDERSVSATSVQLKFIVCLSSNVRPNSIKKSLNAQIASERAGIPTETIRGCVTINVRTCKDTPIAPGPSECVLPDDIAWLELHTSIANEVRNCSRAEPSVSKNFFASLSDVTESGSSWSTARPLDVDGACSLKGIDTECITFWRSTDGVAIEQHHRFPNALLSAQCIVSDYPLIPCLAN